VIGAQSSPEEVRSNVLPFLRRHSFADDVRLSVLRGGANNRVYLVEGSGREAILKSYFQHPGDDRDRYQTERFFYEFLHSGRVSNVPESLGWDATLRVGLFARVGGRKLTGSEVDLNRLSQAAEFVLELNRNRNTAMARKVPLAAEACFTIKEHVACIDRRVERLREIGGGSDTDAEATAFVREKLSPKWGRIRESIQEHGAESGLLPGMVLAAGARVLSPSDFGFHNALLMENGELCFFDFEYAGWDDPAKLICDFFCQPELPVLAEHRDVFASRLSESFALDGALSARWRLLFPAYQIKWCCILLNEFVRGASVRRDYAMGSSSDRKSSQLEKARQMLDGTGKQ